VQKLIDLNFEREKNTYKQMFNSSQSIVGTVNPGRLPITFKSHEDRDFEKEEVQMDREVRQMCLEKISDFSFEISKGWEKYHCQEVEDVQEFVEQAIEGYKLMKRMGKRKEQMEFRQKIIETKYAKEHLKMTMSMDFTKPTEKMKKRALETGIDIHDKGVIEEFKYVQE
jgi:hypothetical protein